MRVTVYCSTARLGGLDITIPSIAAQTRKPDFFVLADEWWHLRFRNKIEDMLPFPAIHLFPGWEGFGVSRIARGHNCAAAHGRDGLLICMNDWMWVPPDWVERMAGYAERNPNWTLCGAQYRYDLSDVLEIGVFGSLRGHVPTEGLFSGRQPIFKDYRAGQIRRGAPEGMDELPPQYWFGGINDSMLAEHWHGVGGADERYDGAGGGQDIDAAFRASRLGARFAFDSTLITYEVRGHAHDLAAYHRCPVTNRPSGVEHVREFMEDYHRRIETEGAPLDWRKDVSGIIIPGMNIARREVLA